MNKYIGFILKTSLGYVATVGKEEDDGYAFYVKKLTTYVAFQTLSLAQELLNRQPCLDVKYLIPVETNYRRDGTILLTTIIDAQEHDAEVPKEENDPKKISDFAGYVYTVKTSILGQENGLNQFEEINTPDLHRVSYEGGAVIFSFADKDGMSETITYAPGMWVVVTSEVRE